MLMLHPHLGQMQIRSSQVAVQTPMPPRHLKQMQTPSQVAVQMLMPHQIRMHRQVRSQVAVPTQMPVLQQVQVQISLEYISSAHCLFLLVLLVYSPSAGGVLKLMHSQTQMLRLPVAEELHHLVDRDQEVLVLED